MNQNGFILRLAFYTAIIKEIPVLLLRAALIGMGDCTATLTKINMPRYEMPTENIDTTNRLLDGAPNAPPAAHALTPNRLLFAEQQVYNIFTVYC